MTTSLIFITLSGLLGCALAQGNGIYSQGFSFSDSSPKPIRLPSARLHHSPTTTEPTQPLLIQQTEQQFQNAPVFRTQPAVNSAVFQYQEQEPVISRRQQVQQQQIQQQQLSQPQQSVLSNINNQQVEDSGEYVEEEIYNQTPKPAFQIRTRGGSPLSIQSPLSVQSPLTVQPSQEAQIRNEKERLEQNKNAKYSFNSVVSDTIYDNSHVREEVRDGLKLAGLYSYSDGFFKRTVHYVADENGYRVVKEDTEPIGDGEGPLLNPNGEIDVAANYDGAGHQYHATIKDITSLNKGPQGPSILTSSQPQPSILSSNSQSKLLTPPALKLRQ